MTDRRLLRETIRHQEAANRLAYETPPVAESTRFVHWEDMMRDAVVSACIQALTSAILARPPYVRPHDQNRASLLMAAWLEKELEAIPLQSVLEDALEALWRGFSVHEIAWRYADRLFHLHSLAAIDPDQIAFEVDEQMQIRQIISRPQMLMHGQTADAPRGGEAAQRLPLSKVWLHRHRPSRRFPAGRSLLEPAFRAWNAKDQLLRFWGLAIQRYGMPLFLVQAPESLSAEHAQSIVEAFYSLRLDGSAILPDTVAYQAIQPSYTTSITFSEAIHYHDAQIKTALLLQFTQGSVIGREYITGEGLEQLAKTTAYALRRFSRELTDSFNRQVVQPLFVANFGPRAPAPSLLLPDPGETELMEMAGIWRDLVKEGLAGVPEARAHLGLEP